jgi:sulfur carrier protein ThiS
MNITVNGNRARSTARRRAIDLPSLLARFEINPRLAVAINGDVILKGVHRRHCAGWRCAGDRAHGRRRRS